jgi:glycogen operon protein
VRLRQEHPTFHRQRFFTGTTVRTPVAGGEGDRLNDIVWLHLDGRPMEDHDWNGDDASKALGMYLNGQGIAGRDGRGEPIVDDHFLLYFNADGPATVTLPPEEFALSWRVVVDTAGTSRGEVVAAGAQLELASASSVVLQEFHDEPEGEPDSSVAASVAAQTGGGEA